MLKLNRSYGRIVDGKLIYAPSELPSTITDDEGNEISGITYNPPDHLYRIHGYEPVVKDPYPEQAGNNFYEQYVEEENGIIRIHYREEVMPPAPPTTDERVEATEAAILDLAELIGGLL